MKTVKRSELSNLRMVAGNELKYHTVIMEDGVVKEWVGFGWVGEDQATKEDRKLYPTVVE